MAIISLIQDQLKKLKQYFDPLLGGLLPDYEEFQLEDGDILVWYVATQRHEYFLLFSRPLLIKSDSFARDAVDNYKLRTQLFTTIPNMLAQSPRLVLGKITSPS
jgi:hypothetical protein